MTPRGVTAAFVRNLTDLAYRLSPIGMVVNHSNTDENLSEPQ